MNRLHEVVMVSQGADELAREKIRNCSQLIGAVAYTPERYGETLTLVARQILKGIQTPPAIYINPIFINCENIDQYCPESD